MNSYAKTVAFLHTNWILIKNECRYCGTISDEREMTYCPYCGSSL